MSDKKKLEIKSVATPDELKNHLIALAESFGRGKVVLEQGGRYIALEPAEHTEIQIEAELKKGRAKLAIEITWHAPAASHSGSSLKISSEEPERALSDDEDDDESSDEVGDSDADRI